MSSDEIRLDGALNFFVGGNKLGRGVTIRNLLVSYLQVAIFAHRTPIPCFNMHECTVIGERDVGVTRLFLPQLIADNFRSIHDMDDALRDLIRSQPEGRIRGSFSAEFDSWHQ